MTRIIRALKTPVTLLILMAFVGFAAKWGLENAREEIPERPRLPCVVEKIGPKYKPEHAVVYVYNATDRNGLARRVGQVLLADGFQVLRRVNADERSEKTKVIGFAEDSPEVVLVRSYLPKAEFVADGRPDHSVDIILGDDFTELHTSRRSRWICPTRKRACPRRSPSAPGSESNRGDLPGSLL